MRGAIYILDISNKALKKILLKYKKVRERSKFKIPATTINGIHDDRSDLNIKWAIDDGINWWTNGFWSGILLQLYEYTKDSEYLKIANISENKLDKCFSDYYGLHHDVGFMWIPTSVANYKLTGNNISKKRALHAANLLAGRFNPKGRFIRAWNDSENKDTRGWAIVDCMFNIALLHWASNKTLDPRFRQIAIMHADTVLEKFVRPDGSCNHIVEFNLETGNIVKTYSGQGFADGSSWTRGQAWGLYGFVINFILSKKDKYLETAKKIANYFIANIPEDGLIPVDFRQPKEVNFMDDTASAIAASGLIELSNQVDNWDKKIYLNAAQKLLKSLLENHCDFSLESDCLLTHCSNAYHDSNHHFSLIYADYFFIEALLKINNEGFSMWF